MSTDIKRVCVQLLSSTEHILCSQPPWVSRVFHIYPGRDKETCPCPQDSCAPRALLKHGPLFHYVLSTFFYNAPCSLSNKITRKPCLMVMPHLGSGVVISGLVVMTSGPQCSSAHNPDSSLPRTSTQGRPAWMLWLSLSQNAWFRTLLIPTLVHAVAIGHLCVLAKLGTGDEGWQGPLWNTHAGKRVMGSVLS